MKNIHLQFLKRGILTIINKADEHFFIARIVWATNLVPATLEYNSKQPPAGINCNFNACGSIASYCTLMLITKFVAVTDYSTSNNKNGLGS